MRPAALLPQLHYTPVAACWRPCEASSVLVADMAQARQLAQIVALLLCAGGALARPGSLGSSERALLQETTYSEAPWVRATSPLAPITAVAAAAAHPPARLAHTACKCIRCTGQAADLGILCAPQLVLLRRPAAATTAPAQPPFIHSFIHCPAALAAAPLSLPAPEATAVPIDVQVAASDLRTCSDVLKNSLSPPPEAIVAAVFAARGLENYTCSE